MSGDISNSEGAIPGIQYIEARDAAKHPAGHRKTLPAPRIIQPKMSVVLRLWGGVDRHTS